MLFHVTLGLASSAGGHILEKNSFTCVIVKFSHDIALADCVQDLKCKGSTAAGPDNRPGSNLALGLEAGQAALCMRPELCSASPGS